MGILSIFLIIPFPISSRWCFIKNRKLKSLFFIEKKGEIESIFWNTPSGGLKLNHSLVQYGFYPMSQFGLVSRCGKKLILPFVMKVPFVALKWILSNSLCMITWFNLVFSEIPLCKYCFIYMCALFGHFSGSIFTKKGYYSRKQGFR